MTNSSPSNIALVEASAIRFAWETEGETVRLLMPDGVELLGSIEVAGLSVAELRVKAFSQLVDEAWLQTPSGRVPVGLFVTGPDEASLGRRFDHKVWAAPGFEMPDSQFCVAEVRPDDAAISGWVGGKRVFTTVVDLDAQDQLELIQTYRAV